MDGGWPRWSNQSVATGKISLPCLLYIFQGLDNNFMHNFLLSQLKSHSMFNSYVQPLYGMSHP